MEYRGGEVILILKMGQKKIDIWHLLILFALAYYFTGYMIGILSNGLPLDSYVMTVASFLLLAILFIDVVSKKVKLNSICGMISLLYIISVIPTILLYGNTSFLFLTRMLSEWALWGGVIYFFYKMKKYVYTPFFIGMLIMHVLIFFFVKSFSAGRGIPLISSAYYALFLLPFVLLIHNRLFKILLMILVAVPLILSMKRTGIAVYIIAVVVYFIINSKMIKTKKTVNALLSKIILLLVGIIGFIVMFGLISKNYDIYILERFLSIAEDGGSGRTEIWATTWNMFLDGNWLEKLFGHGFNAVYHDSPLSLSAHCDYLEIIYDFGVLGFLIISSIFYRLYKYFKILYHIKSEYAAPFAVSLVIPLVMMVSSHIFIYPTYFIYICAFWGMTTGKIDNQLKRTG